MLSLSTKEFSLMPPPPLSPSHDPNGLWDFIRTSPEKVAGILTAAGLMIGGAAGVLKTWIGRGDSQWGRLKDVVDKVTSDNIGLRSEVKDLKEEVRGFHDRLEGIEKEHLERVASMQATINDQARQILDLKTESANKDLMLRGYEASFMDYEQKILTLNQTIQQFELTGKETHPRQIQETEEKL